LVFYQKMNSQQKNLKVEEWTGGYVVETEYTYYHYNEISPANLSFVAKLKGLKPVPYDKPFTYFELGCGKGLSTNLYAAAYPYAQFYGNDFNPIHIESANKLAKAVGSTNITFVKKSFEDLLGLDLPDFDYIVLHGIYTWVSEENRSYIVDFIAKHLKPGGMVYVSYNCITGSSDFVPLRRLLNELSERAEGSLEERVKTAFSLVQKINSKKTQFFKGNSHVKKRFENFFKGDVKYVSHELFSKHWTLFHHADVANELKRAGVSFVGLGDTIENYTEFIIPPEHIEFFNTIKDPDVFEMMTDLILNRQYRADIFQSNIKKEPLESLFSDLRFALITPRLKCESLVSLGILAKSKKIKESILDQLVDGPKTAREIVKNIIGSDFSNEDLVTYINEACALVALNYVAPALSKEGEQKRKKMASHFNDVLTESAVTDIEGVLSPVLGAAVRVQYMHKMFVRGIKTGEKDLVDYVWKIFKAKNIPVTKEDGKKIKSEKASKEELNNRLETFNKEHLSLWQNLGIL